MPLYGCMPPTGYKWDEADWVSTGALVDRMNFALALAANRLPGITVEWAPELDMSTLDSDRAGATGGADAGKRRGAAGADACCPGGVSETTRAAALEQFEEQNAQNGTRRHRLQRAERTAHRQLTQYEREDQLLAGLLMGSPEFQRQMSGVS